jgi:mono/diheme cytochrome c family protein
MGLTHLRAAALAAASLLLGAGHLLPRAAAQRAKRTRVDARAVYTQYCARCHGAGGAADTELARLYNATNFTDADWWRKERPTNARMRRVIANGGSGMPAFRQRLSAAKINALIPYVRAFKGK